MGSGPSMNFPSQPTYGEGMADAMKAQMEMLTGQTLGKDESFEELYASALGREGGTLADIIREFEAPLRRETAQIDTDILRQTILGGEQRTDEQGRLQVGSELVNEKGDPLEARYKSQGGRILDTMDNTYVDPMVSASVVGEDVDSDTLFYNDKEGRQRFTEKGANALKEWSKEKGYDKNKYPTQGGIWSPGYNKRFISSGAKPGAIVSNVFEVPGKTGTTRGLPEELWTEFSTEAIPNQMNDHLDADGRTPVNAVRKPVYETDPGTGQPKIYKNDRGEVLKNSPVREGTGMVDVLGDTRRAPATMDDYGDYVRANPDLINAYTQARAGGEERSMEEWGRDHYAEHGKFEGRDLMTRQSGFDEQGNFLGLAALAEDVQRGHLSRQREADLMDVARLSGQYQDIMEDYRPGTQEALDSARKVLEGREKDLTGGAITVPTGSTYGGDVDAITAATAPELEAATAFGGELAAAGEDVLRQRLLAEAKTGLGEGLTARELRNIQEGTRAAATARGRVRDIGSVQQEVEARLLEDRNRQAMNRAFAQQVLGQEAGLQTGDLGRGMQQEGMQADITQRRDLAQFGADVDRARMEQAQAQQAGQFDVGAKLDAERIGEQLKQSGTLGYIDAATRLAALEDRNQLDPFQAVLGRGGGGSLGAGQSLFGQAGYGLQSGPQYLNPEAGLGYISNMAANEAAMWGAGQQADASRYSGGMSLLGSLAKPIIGKLPVICWVAREVYGVHNPAWLDFREWILLRAPSWFRALYIGYGERFAKFISDKPRLKARIRSWMDTKIGRA
jgi:hypothetical protein